MTNPADTTVAVFGATGKQGGAVVTALLDHGAKVRALVRAPDSDPAQALAARGVELVPADAGDSKSLSAALAGVDAFFFMTTAAEDDGEAEQGIALTDAAVAAGVPRVVFSSVGGAERKSGVPHFEAKRRVEERLEGSGLSVTIVRPVFFMDNFFFMVPSIENGEAVLRLPLPDGVPLQLVASHDIGEIAAKLLLEVTEAPGGAVEIAGDELTGSQIAEAFAAHTGRTVRYEALPIEVLDGQDDMQRMFRWFADTDAYEADLATVRSIHSTTWDLPTWLRSSGWSLPA